MSFWDHNPSLAKHLAAVDEKLQSAANCKEKLIQEAVTELINAPGKRIRSAVTLLSASFGTFDESAISVAAAIELLHMATLVHDDIIDEVKLRRGVPTTQSRFGKDCAVYTGDWLFVKSFQLLCEAKATEHLEPLARAMQRICEGEVNQYSNRYIPRPSVLAYLRRIRGKTAILFALAAAVGAKQAQCQEKEVRLLARYGLYLGMAFQIQDDILDLVSTEEKMGKPVGNDIKEGVYTLPIIYTLMNSQYSEKLKDLLAQETTQETLEGITDLVTKAKGIEQARKLLQKYLTKAMDMLQQLPPNSNRETLQLLLEVPFQSIDPLQAWQKSPKKRRFSTRTA